MCKLTETHVYMQRHQGAKVEHFDVSNVIYHKFLYDVNVFPTERIE